MEKSDNFCENIHVLCSFLYAKKRGMSVNALMIGDVLRFNAAQEPVKMGTFSRYDHPHTLERYAQIADYLGAKGTTNLEKLEGLIAAIDELKRSVGMKRTIVEYGIEEQAFLDTLDEMVEQAFDGQCTGANPRYPLMSEIRRMYLDAYYGRKSNETDMPDETQFARVKTDSVKNAYRKA